MRAEIDKNGGLKLIPETEVEEFALKVWFRDYTKMEPLSNFSSLEVCYLTTDNKNTITNFASNLVLAQK
jgi:hypothetical protein